MVLDNLAMFSSNPEVLPWHVRINDRTVQINDQGGVPELGLQWGSSPGFSRAIQATRSVTEQWGADAVTDPLVLKILQDVYREALGLPPNPDPRFLQEAIAARSQRSGRANPGQNEPALPEELPPQGAAPSPTEKAAVDNSYPLIPLHFDVPTGWFCAGCKRQVPPDACFVGHCGDRYVWVMPEGVADLSRFTLIVLAITKRNAVDNANSRGLVFTR